MPEAVAEPSGHVREEEHPGREEGGDGDRLVAEDPLVVRQVERQKQDDRRFEVSVRERGEARRLDPREDGERLRPRCAVLFGRVVRASCPGARDVDRVGLEAQGGVDGGGGGDDPRRHEGGLEREGRRDDVGRDRSEHVSDRHGHRVEAHHLRLVRAIRAPEEDRLAAHPEARREHAPSTKRAAAIGA